MKLYIIAGEDSGDLHAAHLLRALKPLVATSLQARGVGGEQLRVAGMHLVAHVRDINFMGFVEVVRHLQTIRRLFRTVEQDLQAWQPDAVLLVDYPGFNLRIARFVRRLGIPVYYYISPQVWAWKQGRVEQIRRDVDRMFVILPFEQAFYASRGVEVDFVGHPLLDHIDEPSPASAQPPLVALLPGSRKQEIRRVLPVMLAVAAEMPHLRFVIAGAPSQDATFYERIIGTQSGVELRMNQTYALLREASCALVTSGTATLETALFGVPEVVLYKGGWLSYAIGRRLVKVPFISLVNLILGRAAVRELIQNDCTPETCREALEDLLRADTRARLRADYRMLRGLLGERGASERTAKALLAHMAAQGKEN
ncbi:MAG: lipid-A-disaccharide synthase [Bacteroidia bacterium]